MMNGDLNRYRSTALGEEHDSKSGAQGFGRQVGGKSGKDSTTVAVAFADSAPDSSKSVFSLSRVSFVDVGNTLAEVVLGAVAIVHTFKSQDSLIGVLVGFGSELIRHYLLKLKNLALTHSLTCLPGPALAIFLLF
jgi:hypothetical protein